jgi:nitronate monooxygenase
VGNIELQRMLLGERPAVVSFHFGLPEQGFIDALRTAGIVTLACATTLDEARQIERAGIDAVVAQGIEASGHRGIFDPVRDEMLGCSALVQLLIRHIRLPVVAAGGIMDGCGICRCSAIGSL